MSAATRRSVQSLSRVGTAPVTLDLNHSLFTRETIDFAAKGEAPTLSVGEAGGLTISAAANAREALRRFSRRLLERAMADS